MGSSSSSSGGSVQVVYYESEESKRIRAERAIEESNRAAAAKELPKFLGMVQDDFSKNYLSSTLFYAVFLYIYGF